MAGPYSHPESPFSNSTPQQSFPPPGGPQVPSPYPGTLPPPVDYPKTPRKRRFLAVGLGLLVALVVAAVVVTMVLAGRRTNEAVPGTLSQDSAKAAIQDYLDALAQGKDERIAEHASCGLFDAIDDRQADMSLANLASDAFRRQFKSAEVDSIDKIVPWSENQAQVLFTMKAQPAGRSAKSEVKRQAVAQLLLQKDQSPLVCSYLPRNAGPF
jgi:hypothetical protein